MNHQGRLCQFHRAHNTSNSAYDETFMQYILWHVSSVLDEMTNLQRKHQRIRHTPLKYVLLIKYNVSDDEMTGNIYASKLQPPVSD